MARFALVKPDNSTIDRMASNIDPTVGTKPGFRWISCPPAAQPSFDPVTETVDGPTYVVNANDVTEVWTRRPLTVQEISDRKDVSVSSLNGTVYAALAKVLLNHENRIRALEAKAPITMAQFKTGVKALL